MCKEQVFIFFLLSLSLFSSFSQSLFAQLMYVPYLVRFVDISSDSVDWWDGLARPVELAPSAREKVKSRMESITAHTITSGKMVASP
jgi:hypothetical protein